MASQLETYFAQFVTALGADDEDHPLYEKVHFGRKFVDRNQDAPRIVVWRSSGQIVAPDKVGMGSFVVGDATIRSRVIATRKSTIQVYCHGQTDEQTEELLHNAIQAWRNLTHNDMRFGQEDWPYSAESHNNRKGEEAIFSLELWFHVYDLQFPLTFLEGGFSDEDVWGDESEPVDCKPTPSESSES